MPLASLAGWSLNMGKMHQKCHSLTEHGDIPNNPISQCAIIDDMGIEYIANRYYMKYFYFVVFLWALVHLCCKGDAAACNSLHLRAGA